TPLRFSGYPIGVRAGQLCGVKPPRERGVRPTDGDQFLQSFGKPERSLTCECERSEDATLGQAFQLISGPTLNKMVSEPGNRIGRLVASGTPESALIEEFYLAALCRLPTNPERDAVLAQLTRAEDRRAALEDFVWALVNTKEF